MLVFIAFALLVGATAFAPVVSSVRRYGLRPSKRTPQDSGSPQDLVSLNNAKGSQPYRGKPLGDWILDGAGLFVQGIVIPILQITVVYHLWEWLMPHAGGMMHLGTIPAFLLSFVGVDYFYYWNHRLLHAPGFWNIHKVHHTVSQMDVLGTSRNTLWSSFFIVYLWVHGLMIFLLADPTAYILGVSLTSALDLWRHSSFSPQPRSILYRTLSPWLMLPHDHAHHHRSGWDQLGSDVSEPHRPSHLYSFGYNFGANLKIWDRLHHTYQSRSRFPKHIGTESNLSLVRQLLFPF